MPYVSRNEQGAIVGLLRDPTLAGGEYLPPDHADVAAFLGVPAGDGFSRLDADFVRVLEDVIDALLMKNLINITDLPEQAQAKLFARKSFRERVTQHSLRLFADTGTVEVIGDTNLGDLR
jgi:hypothetical protein